jgi:metal-responsive CopG/Arc/MetJ family transcriptional regulator
MGWVVDEPTGDHHMQRKTKINVLLPIRLVGELDSLSRLGKRSNFIEEAIKEKLKMSDISTINDASTNQLMAALSQREDVSEFVLKVVKMELGIQ